jgi:hypothetical protein
MAKIDTGGLATGVSPGDLDKIDLTNNSKALNRVLKHKTGEGIYLSKYQLFQLGKSLQEMADGPKGIWFLIGEAKVGPKTLKTIELIPYEETNPGKITISKSEGIRGGFKMELGGLYIDNNAEIILNNVAKKVLTDIKDSPIPDTKGTNPVPSGGNSQRTPPPSP